MFPTPFSIRRPAWPAPLGHACSIRAGPRVGLQPSSAEDRRATVGEKVPSRAAATGQRPGHGEMRGLGAIALSSRASLQPPFATLPVTGHVRLSQNSAPQAAEPDGATADSGPRLRHRGPRSEHARSRRALAWASPSPSEAVHLFEAPHSHESAPQTAEPDGATADSGPRL